MKLYGGMDLHSNNSVISIKDEKGDVKARKKLPNELCTIFRFLAAFKASLAGLVVESTYNWYWLVDGLMEAGFRVHLANTTAIQQYSGLKYADDNSDADWLAEMLRLDILPEGYIYPKEERTIRDLMRKRMQLVQQSTKNLLSIQGIYTRHLNYRISNNKIKQLTEKQIEKDFSFSNVILAAQSNLIVMNCLKKQIKNIETSLVQQVKLRPEFKQLLSIDGFGNILSLTIMLETGDLSRFDKVGNYASYCRCVSGARYSNGKKKGKTNQTVAIKTVAHKLARACFYVLRDQVPFDVKKAFC